MAPSFAKQRSGACRFALLAFLWLGLFPGREPCRAESPVHYFPARTFEIPFEMNPARAVSQVLLHVSTDGKSYKQVAAANARDTHFVYTAPNDGWYFFIVQVEQLGGQLVPKTVALAPPGLRVCVDTVKPTAKLKAVVPQGGNTVAVEWEVSDPNLDLRTLQLQYASRGSGRWITLHIRQMERAQFSWRPLGPGPFDVRLQVADLAGNIATAGTVVTPSATATSGAGFAAAPGAGPRVIHVRGKTFKLNYKTATEGPSGVKHVEVWWTQNVNRWQRYNPGVDAPANGPLEVTVPATGRWGFTLRPISGVGRAVNPPRAGELPQLWVEVDDKAPEVLLHSVVVGDGPDSGTITVNWQATDRWLRARPITIKYGTVPTGPWTDLQANVENTGTCKCSIKELPPGLFEFYVRVEATDEAGNTGGAQTRETIKVDLKLPRVEDLSVDVGPADTAPKPPG
jgi:hypothetical protein